MLLYPVQINNLSELKRAVEKIGADVRSLAYFEPKREVLKIYIHDVDFRAAAFIKQETLARGGDAVVHRNIIDAKVEQSDILILATRGQLTALAQKMRVLDCWGLKTIREGLENFLKISWAKKRTAIMGILNLTPDSFHAPSRIESERDLIERAQKMLMDGAEMLDVGAESTRPGATPLSLSDERERLIPRLKTLVKNFPNATISVDTMKPEIAREAAEAGAKIINDVGNDAGMADVARETGLALVVLPPSPSAPPPSEREAKTLCSLSEKIAYLRARGVEKIIIDPGIGFGTSGADNFTLLSSIDSLRIFDLPILVGHSRKTFLNIDGTAPNSEDRLSGTLAVSALLTGHVDILRVHDVLENARAVRTAAQFLGDSE